MLKLRLTLPKVKYSIYMRIMEILKRSLFLTVHSSKWIVICSVIKCFFLQPVRPDVSTHPVS
jgi:hypothetical protein